jgi:hypothetical protein
MSAPIKRGVPSRAGLSMNLQLAGTAMTTGLGVTLAALGFALIGYFCLVRPGYLQERVLRWRNLREPSWELSFLRSPAYLWMVRFVGLIAGIMGPLPHLDAVTRGSGRSEEHDWMRANRKYYIATIVAAGMAALFGIASNERAMLLVQHRLDIPARRLRVGFAEFERQDSWLLIASRESPDRPVRLFGMFPSWFSIRPARPRRQNVEPSADTKLWNGGFCRGRSSTSRRCESQF